MRRQTHDPVALTERVDQLVLEYYTDYYRDQLSLPDWEGRTRARLSEDQSVARFIRHAERWIGERLDRDVTTLVVGGGTGAEFAALLKRGCKTFAVEPDPLAARIGSLRAKVAGANPSHFTRSEGESLPLADASFDFVWCIAVLEHVQDVERCIGEMIRVTKPLGRILIVTYDYRHIYEPHYKMTLPLFLPRWVLRVILKLRGRPPEFLDTLQFVNGRVLANIFQEHQVTAFHVIHPWPEQRNTFRSQLVKWVTRKFGVQQEQWWLLQKLPETR